MRLAWVVLVLVLSSACVTTDPADPGADGQGGSGGTGDATRAGYPPAPYGLREGSTIEDLVFESRDGAFTLHDVHADGRIRTLLLTSVAGWSTGCIEMQPRLRRLHDEYAGLGLAVVETVFETPDYFAAMPDYADDWQGRYALPFPVVADPAFVLADYYDPTMTPMDMVIDVDNMRIRLIETGFDETLVRAAIEASLAR